MDLEFKNYHPESQQKQNIIEQQKYLIFLLYFKLSY